MCYIRIFELCDRLLLNNKISYFAKKYNSWLFYIISVLQAMSCIFFTKKICMSKGMYVRYILDLYRQL